MLGSVVASLLLALLPAEADPGQICKYHDVVEYLNITSNSDLFLYTKPKRNWKEPVEVELDFTFASIISIREKLQTATFYFWLTMEWKNDFVSWNPLDFCNISSFSMPASLFWAPEIFIDEQADEDKSSTSLFVHVQSNGQIKKVQVYRLTAFCGLLTDKFPFEKQRCNISIFSTVYPVQDLILKNIKTSEEATRSSLSYHLTHGEWKFINLRVLHHNSSADGMYFSMVTYQIVMQRRPILHVLNMILPTCALFLLDIAISFTPASFDFKINFKITLILEVCVLSWILNDILPAASDSPPVIAMFFSGVFLSMVICLLENCLLMTLKERKPLRSLLNARKLLLRFFKKEKKTSGNLATHHDEVPPGQGETWDPNLSGKEGKETVLFLKERHSELQIIQQLASSQDEDQAELEWEQTLIFLEKVFSYTHLIVSVLFFAFIIIKWSY
ncbi:PREDICTED: 5-hydroxytryptamine receptor 3A-like [Crocodylus porosus]|uniref:5-hydroxytryptamine receptor 3A-like n=1 Tax=Crocodylus porosus TaxID=8502 RepID=UPI000939EBA6|nr:PREDICTED: 5-hydroxytryptamine receptor 3A-like [Crocodylus porosus]